MDLDTYLARWHDIPCPRRPFRLFPSPKDERMRSRWAVWLVTGVDDGGLEDALERVAAEQMVRAMEDEQ